MDFVHFKATLDDDNRRLDRVIRRILNEKSLSDIFGAIRKGLVRVNGKKCEISTRIFNGDDVCVADFLLNEKSQKSNEKIVKIKTPFSLSESTIFKNEHLLFLNKPYDIPVQPSKNSPLSLCEIVSSDFKSDSLSFRTGALHRLDRKTTGAICFSQSLLGAQEFSSAMREGKIKKTYIALCDGFMKNDFEWEDKIEKAENTDGFQTVKTGLGKIAKTSAHVLAHAKLQNREVSIVRFWLKTGRTHQIRAQAAAHGFSLFGDSAYGSKKADVFGRDFFLHAQTIFLPNSICENLSVPKRIDAPLPKKIETAIKKFDFVDLISRPLWAYD